MHPTFFEVSLIAFQGKAQVLQISTSEYKQAGADALTSPEVLRDNGCLSGPTTLNQAISQYPLLSPIGPLNLQAFRIVYLFPLLLSVSAVT